MYAARLASDADERAFRTAARRALAAGIAPADLCFAVPDAPSLFHDLPDIAAEPGIPLGQPCGYSNDCEPGNQCLEASFVPGCVDASCCSAYCDLSLGDAECAAQPGSVCTAFFLEGEVPAGFENVGVCTLPP